MSFVLHVVGRPIGKARPRVTSRGTFTPKQTRAAEKVVRTCFLRKYPNPTPLDGPVRLRAVFSFYAKGKSGPRTSSPDIDNLVKLVQDALNGLAYHDDRQVTEIRAEKVYGDSFGTYVEVDPVGAEE